MNHFPLSAPYCVSFCAWTRGSAKLSTNWGKNSCQTFSSRLMLLCQPIIGSPSSDSPLQDVKTRPARQQGCEEYESLSHLEKIVVHFYPFKLPFFILSALRDSTVSIFCFRKPFGRFCYGALASVPQCSFSLWKKKRICIKKGRHCWTRRTGCLTLCAIDKWNSESCSQSIRKERTGRHHDRAEASMLPIMQSNAVQVLT